MKGKFRRGPVGLKVHYRHAKLKVAVRVKRGIESEYFQINDEGQGDINRGGIPKKRQINTTAGGFSGRSGRAIRIKN